MNEYSRALELKEETIRHRRYIHAHAETGLELPQTVDYVMQTLTEYGLHPRKCGHGVIASLGHGGKTLLLRADMDALPLKEESGETFACPTGKAAHACGHDFHTAILLTTAKMLKEQESKLAGTVFFMFQPAEETFQGARDMIAAGLFDQVQPDAALALHVTAGQMNPGMVMYNNTGTMMSSVDGFRIHIQGKGAHGAYPQDGIDPITIGVQIHLALSELIAHEADPAHSCVLSIGHFEAGKAPNIIPDTALMEGTLRTKDEAARKKLVKRIQEICDLTARRYGGSATIEVLSDMNVLNCDPETTTEMMSYIRELSLPDYTEYPGITANASDDFAMITSRVPSTYLNVSAGFPDERGLYPIHHPKVRFNEDVCPIGTAILTHCSLRWLEEHR